MYLEQMHKVMYDVWKQLQALRHCNGNAGELVIQNTFKDFHTMKFKKITSTKKTGLTLCKCTIQLKQKELRETAITVSKDACADLSNSNERCILCNKKPIIYSTVEEEAALVNELNL